MTTGTVCGHLEFIELARSLQQRCAALDLVVPAFRSHPHFGTRSLRRHPGQVVVLVALGREWSEVAEDCVDGTVRAQPEPPGEAIRAALWEAIEVPV